MTYVPGQPQKWGAVFRHQHAAGTEWALRRQHLLGKSAQLLLLARPGEESHRRALHPRSCPSTTGGSSRSTAPSSAAFTGGWAAP